MSDHKSINIMSYDIFIGSLKQINIISNSKKIINTINPHSYITAKKDKVFENALKNSDILLPDGCGIVMASKYVYGEHIKKISGSDLHEHLLALLNEEGKCFYMGSSWETLHKIKERLSREFPNVDAGFYSPPFKTEYSEEDNQKILSTIRQYKPNVVFIGMTAPKQEKWLYQHQNQIDANVICTIGAVFDFYAGTVQRPSQFWIKNYLEWLPRLLNEPKRLWKRNFISTPLFLYEILLYKFGIKK